MYRFRNKYDNMRQGDMMKFVLQQHGQSDHQG